MKNKNVIKIADTSFNEDVFKRCFEIIKDKVGVKAESVFEKLILYPKKK